MIWNIIQEEQRLIQMFVQYGKSFNVKFVRFSLSGGNDAMEKFCIYR